MIELQDVTKKYGRTTAIKALSLRIAESGIYCLLGRNGAGKTTLLKLLAGYTGCTGGRVAINGALQGDRPESAHFIETGSPQYNMRVADLLRLAGEIQSGFDYEFARLMAGRFELDLRKKYRRLSLGMKSMLTAILSLANNSAVILLDEPVLGFDPIMRERFNALLWESYERHPRIIIVSTHLIDEIARVSQRLIIIDQGRLLLHSSIDELDERSYTVTGPSKLVESLLEHTGESGTVRCIHKKSAGPITTAYLYGERTAPRPGLSTAGVSLQDFFIALVEGGQYA